MITWIVFAAGGPKDAPWEKDLEVQAHDAAGALESVLESGDLEAANIQGIISEQLYSDLGLNEDEGGDAAEQPEEIDV
jgi:hypothetical protein